MAWDSQTHKHKHDILSGMSLKPVGTQTKEAIYRVTSEGIKDKLPAGQKVTELRYKIQGQYNNAASSIQTTHMTQPKEQAKRAPATYFVRVSVLARDVALKLLGFAPPMMACLLWSLKCWFDKFLQGGSTARKARMPPSVHTFCALFVQWHCVPLCRDLQDKRCR